MSRKRGRARRRRRRARSGATFPTEAAEDPPSSPIALWMMWLAFATVLITGVALVICLAVWSNPTLTADQATVDVHLSENWENDAEEINFADFDFEDGGLGDDWDILAGENHLKNIRVRRRKHESESSEEHPSLETNSTDNDLSSTDSIAELSTRDSSVLKTDDSDLDNTATSAVAMLGMTPEDFDLYLKSIVTENLKRRDKKRRICRRIKRTTKVVLVVVGTVVAVSMMHHMMSQVEFGVW